jgi:hypothetical protein
MWIVRPQITPFEVRPLPTEAAIWSTASQLVSGARMTPSTVVSVPIPGPSLIAAQFGRYSLIRNGPAKPLKNERTSAGVIQYKQLRSFWFLQVTLGNADL